MPDDITGNDLPPEQQPEQPQDRSPEAVEAEMEARYEAFDRAVAEDPSLQNFIVEQPLQDEDQPSGRGFWRGLYENIDSVFDVGGPAGIKLAPDVGKAMVRGATRFVDESLEFLAEDVGAPILKHATVGQLLGGRVPSGPTLAEAVFSKEEEEFFRDWYENRSTTETALFGNEFRENHLKYENDTFAVHMIEGLTQFGLGFAGLGKVKGLAGAATLSGRLAQAAFRGGVIDFAAFDPHEQRLSDLIEANPALSNPVTRMLMSDAEDSNMEGRIKNLFEGIVIGSVIDGFTESVKALRAVRRARAGEIEPEEAIAAITEHRRRAREALEADPPADDIVRAVEHEDGSVSIEALEFIDPEGLPPVGEAWTGTVFHGGGEEAAAGIGRFSSTDRAVAAEAGEVVEEAIELKNAYIADASETGWLDDLAPKRESESLAQAAGREERALQEAARRGHDGIVLKKPDGTFDVIQPGANMPPATLGGGVPAKSLQDAQMQAEAINWQSRKVNNPRGAEAITGNAEAWRAATKKLEDATDLDSMLRVHEGSDLPLSYVSEPREIKAAVEAISDMLGPKARETIGHAEVKQAAGELFHGIAPDQVLDWAARTFGETANLAEKMVGMRMYLINHVKMTRQMAKQLDLAPDNPLLATQLGRALDTMYNLYADVAGTGSNMGRALESQKVDVGSLQHMPPELKQAATVRDEFLSAKRAYEATIQSGDSEAIRAALQNLDEIGERMGALVGGRPKNKSGLSGIFDRDARRRAKAEQPQLEGMPPKPDVKDQLPAAMKWYDDAAERINGQVEAGRAQVIEEIPFENPAPHKSFSNMSKEEIRQTARMIFMQDDMDVQAVMGILMSPKRKARAGAVNVKEAIIAFRINAMLSGPQTHLTNSLNNLAFMHLRGLEYWWSGVSPFARRKLRGSGVSAREMRTAGWDLVSGYYLGMGEAWRQAKQAFKIGDNLIKPGSARDGLKQVGEVGPGGRLTGAMWTLLNTPGRMLITADEFAQQMAYRSNVRMQILRKARRESIDDLGKHVTDQMKFAFTEDGRGTIANALRFSEDVTFKTPTPHGTITKTLSEAAQKNGIIRFMFPFLRTPANLIKRGYQRTPLAAKFSKEIRVELDAGGERAAIAQAQIELGSALIGSVAIMAFNGQINGRGPADPELNRQWRAMGNKPYSLRLPHTGVSISFRRADPIMMFPAAVADLVSGFGELKDSDDAMQEALGVLLASATASLGNKSYFQGATSVMEALTSGDPGKWEQALAEAARSFSPALLRQLTFDNMEREVNGFVDRIMNGVPGMSQSLEPRRNIFGEKVIKSPGNMVQQFNPFTVSFMSEQDREINERLFETGRAFSMPSETMANGEIDLTERGKWIDKDTPAAQRDQSPYDRYMELMGQVRIGGKVLREEMVELLLSDRYAIAEKHGSVSEGGAAYTMVADVMTRYQRLAYSRMIREYRPLMRELARIKLIERGEARGLPQLLESAEQFE